MKRYEFKVGDVVRVVQGGWHKSISKPVTIEKQHAGNGNLKVGEHWFDSAGWQRRGRESWGAGMSLVLDGSPECIELRDSIRLERAVSELHGTKWKELPSALVLEVVAKVRAHQQQPAPQSGGEGAQ